MNDLINFKELERSIKEMQANGFSNPETRHAQRAQQEKQMLHSPSRGESGFGHTKLINA